MAGLLDAITRSPTYWSYASTFASREPSDAWYENGHGWLLIFPMRGADPEQALAFTVGEGGHQHRPEVLAVTRFEQQGGGVAAVQLYPAAATGPAQHT